MAKGIYRNSTLEKLALIRMLRDHELAKRHADIKLETEWMNKVGVSNASPSVFTLAHRHLPEQDLQSIAGVLDQTGNRLDLYLARGEAEMTAQLGKLGHTVKEALSMKEEFWTEAKDRWEIALGSVERDISTAIKDRTIRDLEEMSSGLQEIMQVVSTASSCRLFQTLNSLLRTAQ
jgi:hypothetical protein